MNASLHVKGLSTLHLLPKTTTLYPETGDFVAENGNKISCFQIQVWTGLNPPTDTRIYSYTAVNVNVTYTWLTVLDSGSWCRRLRLWRKRRPGLVAAVGRRRDRGRQGSLKVVDVVAAEDLDVEVEKLPPPASVPLGRRHRWWWLLEVKGRWDSRVAMSRQWTWTASTMDNASSWWCSTIREYLAACTITLLLLVNYSNKLNINLKNNLCLDLKEKFCSNWNLWPSLIN